MPKFDMPVDDTDSVDSSILSFSSNENGAASNRSLSSSISFGSANNISPPLLMVEQKSPPPPPKPFDPIVDLHSVCQEPTIDAVLVKYSIPSGFFQHPIVSCVFFFFFAIPEKSLQRIQFGSIDIC